MLTITVIDHVNTVSNTVAAIDKFPTISEGIFLTSMTL